MKKLFFLVLALSFCFSFAQRHEIGVFGGGANVIGDIGKSDYINPLPVRGTGGNILDKLPMAMGIIYRFNFNPHMGLRANAMYGKVVGSDITAPESYKKERGYAFRNNIIEGSIVFEYNLFDINNFPEYGSIHSPYIFGGIGAFMYDEMKYNVTHTFARDEDNVIITPTRIDTKITSTAKKTTKFSIPFGVGYKYKFRENFVISAEVGFRYTQTDNLDYSFSNETDFTFDIEPGLDEAQIEELNSNIIKSRQFGNMSNYDWYVFTGLTLTYTFGRQPCYCD